MESQIDFDQPKNYCYNVNRLLGFWKHQWGRLPTVGKQLTASNLEDGIASICTSIWTKNGCGSRSGSAGNGIKFDRFLIPASNTAEISHKSSRRVSLIFDRHQAIVGISILRIFFSFFFTSFHCFKSRTSDSLTLRGFVRPLVFALVRPLVHPLVRLLVHPSVCEHESKIRSFFV